MEATRSCNLDRIAISLPKSKVISFSNSLNYVKSRSPCPGRLQWFRKGFSNGKITAVSGANGGEKSSSPLDEKPSGLLPDGSKVYLDEQDIVTLLDPAIELVPSNPGSYNPAAYLWKKVEDVPEERRHHLLCLLKPRLISRLWAMAGTRYEDSTLIKKNASGMFSSAGSSLSPEYWSCRTSGGPLLVSWLRYFKKAIFLGNNKKMYGRMFLGGSLLCQCTDSVSPMYFTAAQTKEVMSTEQPCDLAYELGDGLLDLHEYPPGFPKPAEHPWPFDDQVVVYLRHVGPGVMVGQAWQEGKALEQVPKKFCHEILMVKDYMVEVGL